MFARAGTSGAERADPGRTSCRHVRRPLPRRAACGTPEPCPSCTPPRHRTNSQTRFGCETCPARSAWEIFSEQSHLFGASVRTRVHFSPRVLRFLTYASSERGNALPSRTSVPRTRLDASIGLGGRWPRCGDGREGRCGSGPTGRISSREPGRVRRGRGARRTEPPKRSRQYEDENGLYRYRPLAGLRARRVS